jgi:hypothetical protein
MHCWRAPNFSYCLNYSMYCLSLSCWALAFGHDCSCLVDSPCPWFRLQRPVRTDRWIVSKSIRKWSLVSSLTTILVTLPLSCPCCTRRPAVVPAASRPERTNPYRCPCRVDSYAESAPNGWAAVQMSANCFVGPSPWAAVFVYLVNWSDIWMSVDWQWFRKVFPRTLDTNTCDEKVVR